MSKRDIENVTRLAASLTQYADKFGHAMDPVTHGEIRTRGYSDWLPGKIASDAMALQRLGRSATNNATRLCNIPNYQERHDKQAGRIHAQAQAILKPYDLKCTVGGDPRGYCLHILGLPGNTLGGDEDGFGI